MLRLSRTSASIPGGLKHKEEIISNLSQPLSPKDVQTAKTTMFKLMQPEVNHLLSLPPSGKKKSKKSHGNKRTVSNNYLLRDKPSPKAQTPTFNLSSLSPFKQDGIWWTQGRFGLDLQ